MRSKLDESGVVSDNGTQPAPLADSCILCRTVDAALVYEATDRLYGTTRTRFQIIRCTRCGLLRLDPRPTESELPQYYPSGYWFDPHESTATRLAEQWRRLVLRDHVRFIRRAYRSAGARGPVLDVGSGGGLLPAMLAERGVPALAMDISEEACHIACTQNGVPALTARLEHAPFASGTFALITGFHVVEHLRDPAQFLRCARQLLCDAGRLVIQVPNAASWQASAFGSRWNGFDVPRHLTDFREKDIRELLAQSGFEVNRTKYFSLRDNPAGLATSLAPRLDPMARRIRRAPTTGIHLLAYFALTAAATTPALVEALFRRGSTIMIEARK